jgi:hypothetical protein
MMWVFFFAECSLNSGPQLVSQMLYLLSQAPNPNHEVGLEIPRSQKGMMKTWRSRGDGQIR